MAGPGVNGFGQMAGWAIWPKRFL